jgi:hypothetical protein
MTRPICPNCSREYVTRVSRLGILEHLLSLFYVYPFKCQLCGYRFKFVQKGVRYKRIEEDRREYDRLPINSPVCFVGDQMNGEGQLCDISMGGCTFRTATLPADGSIVRMAVQISNDVQPVNIAAAIIRNVRKDHIGVEFLRFEPKERERLQSFIRGHLVSRQA